MTECIHGLELEMCDACTPKKAPVAPPPAPRDRAPRTTAAPVKKTLIQSDSQRLHVVLTLDDFGDVLASGYVEDPIYFHGPEELAWAERRRAANIRDHVVLVTSLGATRGLDLLPLGAVQLIAVANNSAQERVRELLALTNLRTKVSVYPPWFQPSDAE
jgi:hypothetical protein